MATLPTSPIDSGIPDRLQEKYYDTLKAGGKKLWRGMWQVAASGFGKGVLAAAAVAILGSALGFGFLAYAGSMTTASGALATVGEGLLAGASVAINSFFPLGPFGGAGLAVLGLGGALGAVHETRKEQGRIAAEVARAQAHAFELERKLQELKAPERETRRETDTPSRFAERELQRRSERTNPGLGAG